MKKSYLILILVVLALVGAVIIVVQTPNTVATPPSATARIKVSNLKANDIIRSPFALEGEAAGWYFEASFPVSITNSAGKELVKIPATAQSNWMTTDFVPFKARLEFIAPADDRGYVILERDNPSGLPQYDESYKIPIRFR